MKKIINHRRYDTDTAKFLGSATWGQQGSFEACEEDLYRKNTGEYFLHGSGGPQSKYAESCGQNEWSGGEQIIPLSYDNACRWAEENLSGDEYESIFGAIAETGDDITLGVRVSAKAKGLLDMAVSKNNETQAAIIEQLIIQHLS